MTGAQHNRRLLVIGAGGHAKVVIDTARAAGWRPGACLASSMGGTCLGVPVIGSDNHAQALFDDGWRHAVIAIGANPLRERIAREMQKIGFELPRIIHPTALISGTAQISDGVVIMPQVVVNAEARIEFAAIINTGAIVEHDCHVGVGAHVAPRSVLAGTVTIGKRVLFGVGSVARPGISIGDDWIVGAGSVVVADAASGPGTIFGVPARLQGGKDR